MALKSLGRYELLRILGRGAMGVVYEARDPVLDRLVAIKVIRGARIPAGRENEYFRRFGTEARSVARLHHQNVVNVYDFGHEADTAYLVMEYVEGEDLGSWMARHGPPGMEEAVRIVGDLLDALGHAHARGIIHRDVKPANVLLTPDRQVKLTDFGVARMDGAGDGTRTALGSMLGTLPYMAPEQAFGQTVDRRADLFSAGVILYELLTGVRPFTGDGDFAIINQVITHVPPAPSTLDRRLPRALDAIVARALQKKPQDRYQRAEEFGAALARLSPPGRQPGPSSPWLRPGRFLTMVLGVLPRRRPMPGRASGPDALENSMERAPADRDQPHAMAAPRRRP